MTRLEAIRVRIATVSHRLHCMDEDKMFHPWQKAEHTAEHDALLTELRKLRQQEFMLAHHSGVMSGPIPLHRQNGRVEQQPSFMVAFLVFFALICVLVFMLMAAAGVLTQ